MIWAFHCQDQNGFPIEGVTVHILDFFEVEAGLTDVNGNYTTSDLPLPTAFLGADKYLVMTEYWAATFAPQTEVFWDTTQPIVLALELYTGAGQNGGSGSKTLTINASEAECNHIIAINVSQQTSFIFANFPSAFHFEPNDEISIEAFPQLGYEFREWDATENNPTIFTPVDDCALTAYFDYVGVPVTSTEQIITVPKPVVVFGNIFVPEADIIECNVHLGATKEVSSFKVKLQNWGKKYSQSGWLPIQVGATGGIGICRIPYNPAVKPLISLKVEHVEYQSEPTESYAIISGRCWGERLFRRTVTKVYENQKGEAIVKDLLDNFVGLSHTRNGVELVENTDTTYTKLEYVDTPVFDILTYIAQSADKDGVIGFDFRVAPDGKFEFFRKNSKAVTINLTECLESSEYSKDITAVRNKITIYGAADKSLPLNKDDLTELLHPSEGDWSYQGVNGEVAQDSTTKVWGSSSIKCHLINDWAGAAIFTYKTGFEVNTELYPELNLFVRVQTVFLGSGAVTIFDINNNYMMTRQRYQTDDNWYALDTLKAGSKNADRWVPGIANNGFDWTQIKKVLVGVTLTTGAVYGSGDFWVDGLYFGGRRYSAVEEDGASQNTYGLREYVDIDDELYSDNECDLRARAVLDNMKDPAENLLVKSTVIDYGTLPLLAADKVHAELPNEYIDEDFCVVSADYNLNGVTQELEITLELGREAPLLADWMYALRSKLNKVNRLKVAR
jgi:hypothetical protein